MATMIFNEDGSYEVFEEQEVIPTNTNFDELFEKAKDKEVYDQYFLFDQHIKEFDEELVRKYNDQIDFFEFYTNREGKHVKPYFSPNFVRELIAINNFDNELIGEIVSYESGLKQYVNWERQDEPNKKLINEYKKQVKDYWKAVYGPHFKGMNSSRYASGNEIERRQAMKKRLLEYVEDED